MNDAQKNNGGEGPNLPPVPASAFQKKYTLVRPDTQALPAHRDWDAAFAPILADLAYILARLQDWGQL